MGLYFETISFEEVNTTSLFPICIVTLIIFLIVCIGLWKIFVKAGKPGIRLNIYFLY